MENMSKAQKEAHEYKDSPMVKLRFILSIYRFLYFCTNELVEFLISFIPMVIGYLIFVPIGFITFFITISLHYFLIWGYIRNHRGIKLVSDNDREEIKVIIPILEGFIKDRKR